MAVDTLIKDALIVDGTGEPAYHGDIAIKAGRITAVGDTGESAPRVIDGSGLAATPGFWDVHTHYDAQLLWDPLASSSVWHGVTTIVTGNCGFTIAPVRPRDQDYLVRMLARVEGMEYAALESTLPWAWESFGEYLEVLERRLGVNVLPMVGHSAVRRYVLGEEASQRPATPDEIETMRGIVHDSLAAGAFGVSSTRGGTHWDGDGAPVPSRLADDDEFRALVSAMSGMERGFIQGTGGPSLGAELAEIAGRPYLYPQITQVVTEDPDSWRRQLDALQAEIASGKRFFGMGPVNRRQFEMSMDNTNVFDRWATWQTLMSAPLDERKDRLRDPALRDRLRSEMKGETLPVMPFSWELLTLFESPTGRWSRFEGKRVPEIAGELGKDALDTLLDIVLDEDLGTQFHYDDTRYPDEDVLIEILKAPHMLVGPSDAGAHLVTQVDTGFPSRLLGYWVREREALSLEKAVHILAARPADELGVSDRGRLLPGQAADIVLIDLQRVRAGDRVFARDLPRGSRRLVHQGEGIEAVLVNGVTVRRGDADTGDLGGRVLRGPARGG
jgi:N-acyl-D-aspartate/D-glutamate deacylase